MKQECRWGKDKSTSDATTTTQQMLSILFETLLVNPLDKCANLNVLLSSFNGKTCIHAPL
jgi:hypothetical protein